MGSSRLGDGSCTQLAAADTEVSAGKWHEISVVHQGSHIECLLNGQKLLEAHDETLPESGGLGLWTKADAATSFDVFEMKTVAGD